MSMLGTSSLPFPLPPPGHGVLRVVLARGCFLRESGRCGGGGRAQTRPRNKINRVQTQQVGWVLRLISARELSDKMCRKTPFSLNVISHDAAAEMIRAVQARGVRVTQVFVDTVGDPAFYHAKLEK